MRRDGKRYLIELNNRFSYPAACLVLMLVGVPLGRGIAARRQELGIRLHPAAGDSLLHPFLHRRFSRAPGQAAGHRRGMAGEHAFRGCRHLPAVADGQRRTACCSAIVSISTHVSNSKLVSARPENGVHLSKLLGRLQPRAMRTSPRAMCFPAFWMSMFRESSSARSSWCLPGSS